MPDLPSPTAARTPTEHVYLHGSLRLHYETAGSPEGMPVVLLHGLGCNLGLMKGCMEPVFARREREWGQGAAGQTGPAASGYRRVYVDLPGMGASNAPLGLASSDAVLDELVGFVRSVAGGRRFLVAGQSYGGYLARGLAAEFAEQVAGILLICPLVTGNAAALQVPKEAAYRLVDHAYVDDLPPEQRASFMRNAVVADGATHRRFLAELAPGFAQADLLFVDALHGSLAFGPQRRERVAAHVPACPALVVTGRQDGGVGYADAREQLSGWPRATFAVLDVAGHNLQIELPALFEALACDWLARVEEDPVG